MDLLVAARAAGLLAALVYLPGWLAARALGRGADVFARVWWGLALISIAGLVLAGAGRFSLPAVLAAATAAGAIGAALGARRARRAGGWGGDGGGAPAGARPIPSGAASPRALRALAGAAAAAAFLWCWPPFETVLAGADSTMYVSAGLHLARTGALTVRDAVAPLLETQTARGIFPSVRALGGGPYVRLPGGLLKSAVQDGEAVPAFFPLVPVWTACVAAAGGPEAAPAVAPIFAALGVWAAVLFAGETLGLGAAAATALLLLANGVVWWFGRFPMPEVVALTFLWGGLVLLGRGATVSAGVMLGTAGLARTETVLFLLAAVALWLAWTRPGVRLLPLAAGLAPPALLAVLHLVVFPSHHLAYLLNDLGMGAWRVVPRLLAPRGGGLLLAGGAALAAMLLAGGLLGRAGGRPFLRGAVAALALGALAAAVAVHATLGGIADPLGHLGWLAAYCSAAQLALAAAGGVLVWRRGGPAVRLAALLWLLVAVAFVVNPRVAAYQPWAMRRFLPVVIPGIAIAAGAAVAGLAAGPRRAGRLAAALVLAGLVALEVRPVLALRGRPYFAGGFAAVRAIAEMTPPGALVVVDAAFADVQLQVPLWLLHGRETVMVRGGGSRWREVLQALAATGRPLYWIGNRYGGEPSAPGLAFATLAPDPELVVPLPDGPTSTPPTRTVRRIVPLRIFRVVPAGEVTEPGGSAPAE